MSRAGENASPQRRPENGTPVYFEYTGKTSLIAIGSATRLRYHFTKPGAIVAVDVKDKNSLTKVPNLRQVLVNISKIPDIVR